MKRTRTTWQVLALSTLLWFTWVAQAQAPQWVPVQGTLFNADGSAVSDSITVIFGFYTAETGGEPLWEEGRNVTIDRGYFTVFLGESVPLDLTIFRDNSTLFLSVKIDGDEARFPIGSVPFAAFAEHAGNADTLGGVDSDGFAATEHRHGFTDLDEVPEDLADGDDVGTLRCMSVSENVARDPLNSSFFSSIVQCPSGYTVTGGGFSSTPSFATNWTATTSQPRSDMNGWQCLIRTDGAVGKALTCTARCCQITP